MCEVSIAIRDIVQVDVHEHYVVFQWNVMWYMQSQRAACSADIHQWFCATFLWTHFRSWLQLFSYQTLSCYYSLGKIQYSDDILLIHVATMLCFLSLCYAYGINCKSEKIFCTNFVVRILWKLYFAPNQIKSNQIYLRHKYCRKYCYCNITIEQMCRQDTKAVQNCTNKWRKNTN